MYIIRATRNRGQYAKTVTPVTQDLGPYASFDKALESKVILEESHKNWSFSIGKIILQSTFTSIYRE